MSKLYKKTDFLFSSPNWHARRIRIRLIRKPVFHRNDDILKSVTVKPLTAADEKEYDDAQAAAKAARAEKKGR